MSHILFGTCRIDSENTGKIDIVKRDMSKFGIKLWFDDEIDFYDDIQTMIIEQNNNSEYNYIFCITTNNQPTNSDDLLFPYDKYSYKELFPKGNDRNKFNDYCKKNMNKLHKFFLYFTKIVYPQNIKVFLTEGYDDQFDFLFCSIDEMISHILKQVEESHFLNSTIYHIKHELR